MIGKISFWNFLKKNEIEIPIIQRDYAQGRLGKETLRRNFLFSLLNALEAKDNTEMKLDFVYGSIEDDKLNPLDGQQRLTTLWLLHWYIALRAEKLTKETCNVLSRFTYETRISSREFCKNLCIPEHFEKFEGHNIVDFIYKQTWFYSAWKQDPTIQSMLRMLGGTKINDKKGNDIVDGIEEFFECSLENKAEMNNESTQTFEAYWNKLISDLCPIVFYHLPLKDFGLSDDLYIKMNARGKQLTNFENFKADLIGYITSKSEDEFCDENEKEEWKSLLDIKNGFPILLDTKWTDIFWKNKSKDNRIDEIYYAFINRFFLNELICQKNQDEYILNADKTDNNKTFKYLYGKEGNDSSLTYSGIDDYCYYTNEIPLSLFKSLKDALNNLYDNGLNTFFPKWVDSKFHFIPQYTTDGISVLGQKERCVFLAICRYLEKGKFEEMSFRKWMRVVWNLVENAGVNNISSMIGTMRLIDELSLHSHEIYSFLASNPKIESDAAEDQIQEEIIKAAKIIEDSSWEERFIKAEKFAFFKGAISFLFTDGEGNTNWNDFNKKWENAQLYFNKEGVNDPYKKSAILLRALLSRIDISEYWFGNTVSFWEDALLDDDYKSAIHYLLLTDKLEVDKNCKCCWIIDNHLLSTLLKDNNKWHILHNWRGYSVLTRYERREQNPRFWGEIVVFNYLRNKLLHQEGIIIKKEYIINKTRYLYGWDIDFKYKGNNFRWYGDPNDQILDIYLMYINKEGILDYLKRSKKILREETNNKEYFCFRVEKNTTKDTFLKMLDNLISQKKKDKPK